MKPKGRVLRGGDKAGGEGRDHTDRERPGALAPDSVACNQGLSHLGPPPGKGELTLAGSEVGSEERLEERRASYGGRQWGPGLPVCL